MLELTLLCRRLNLPLGVDANAVTKSTQLPADIIALICDQLRDLYEEEEDERPWSSVSTGCRSWRAIKTLSTVNKGCEDHRVAIRDPPPS